MKYLIGIDIGGTNIACGIVDEQGVILHKQSIKTESEKGFEAVVANIAAVVREIMELKSLKKNQIKWIGVGCPGACNTDSGVLEVSNNLKWHNVPLRAELEKLTGIKTFIDNDANAAAYGEFVAGAAKGTNSAIVITLGTGVGSGIIIDKKLLYGTNFAAGELGHTVIEAEGVPCNCGRIGCFEAYSSATGLIRMTREAMELDKDSLMHEIAEKSGKVGARTAWLAAKEGDRSGEETVDKYIRYLACGITNVINTFQPDIVCIGGGVCNEGDNLLLPLKELVSKQVFSRNSAKNSEIAICSLGNDAGIIGAAMLGVQAE
ncbi:MAG: ROK family protein [Oscillospiraceae bacterium]|nr:ROK family protein [Oscillospiraceae bacterium]